MSYQINEAFRAMPQQDFAAKITGEINQFAQRDAFFHLAARKNQRAKGLLARFSGKRPRAIYTRLDLHGSDYKCPGIDVHHLEREWIYSMDDAKLDAMRQQLEDCVVIFNNNDVGRPGTSDNYSRLYDHCDKTIFAVWDWDNHHWLANSTFAAVHSDIYAPAHHENLYLMSRYNWCIAGPVYCATTQWPRAFLTDRINLIANLDRSNEPLGKHIMYPHFEFRNRVVATLNQRYESVGFSTPSFHTLTLEDRLKEWAGCKVHWITPVLNDVPIRIFDALITGGIPLVPESMRMLPPVNQIGREHILFYTPDDIISPQGIVDKAVKLFDEGGLDKVIERHRFALEHHHASVRVDQILRHAADKFEFLL